MGCDRGLRRREIARNMTVSPRNVQLRLAAGDGGESPPLVPAVRQEGIAPASFAVIHTGRREAAPFLLTPQPRFVRWPALFSAPLRLPPCRNFRSGSCVD